MKLYKSLFLLAAAVSGIWLTGCKDDTATLDGSDAVYIDIAPEKIVMCVGDTLPVSARVTNEKGQVIDTPVKWSLDDESVLNLINEGHGVQLVCVGGSLEREKEQYTTNLRATLVNGKYATREIQVKPLTPDGVTPEEETHVSYDITDDVVWFTVSPVNILKDFTPVASLQNDNLTLCDPAIEIEWVPVVDPEEDEEGDEGEEGGEPGEDDAEEGEAEVLMVNEEGVPMRMSGRVGVHFNSKAESGQCVITLTVGSGATAISGKCTVVMHPDTEVSLWDDGHGDGPNDTYIRRMVMGEYEMYRTYSITKSIDINSTSYAYAGVNVVGGIESQIRQAMDLCRWEVVKGNTVLVTSQPQEFLPSLGFDHKLYVASGAAEGETVFNFIAPDSILEVTFIVMDFKKQPVDAIETNAPEDGIKIAVDEIFSLTTAVTPKASYLYHKPVVVAEDPTIVEVGEYVEGGNQIELKGLAIGQTNLVLTANDKTLVIPVTVTEGVSYIGFSRDNATAAFAGQTINWEANVTTTSGAQSQLPISWSTSDETIAVAEQGDDVTTTGVITAKKQGKVNIIATVLSKTQTASLEVIAMPGDFTYTGENAKSVSLGNFGNDGRIKFTGPQNESIEIYLAGYKNKYEFDITDMSKVSMVYNGARISPSSGWILGVDDGEQTTISFELTFTLGDGQFTFTGSGIVA